MPGVGPLHVKMRPPGSARCRAYHREGPCARCRSARSSCFEGLNMKWTGAAAIAAAAVLQAAGPVAPARSSAAPPNIVFILADDLGYGELGAYGQKRIRTPRLDRMSSRER